jgi:hypothetical protein
LTQYFCGLPADQTISINPSRKTFCFFIGEQKSLGGEGNQRYLKKAVFTLR